MLNLDKNQHYLLACSFGPDSMALFDMLEKEGYKFDVAHVNYHLRDESINEEAELRAYCTKHNKTIFVRNVEPNEYKGNLEAKCREIRYKFFKSVSEEYRYDAVLIAHHQDDLIETYLMQKARKSHPLCYGIKEQSIIERTKIIRPLLSYSKDQLLKYCLDNSVPYAIDSSNLEDCFTRNKIRHNIVEKMTSNERKEVLFEIEKMNHQLEMLNNKLNTNNLESISVLNRLNDDEFNAAIIMLGRRIKEKFDCSKRQALEIKKVLASGKPNIALNIKGVFFVKRYDYFIPMSNNDEQKNYSYIIEKPSKLDTEFFYLDFNGETKNRNVDQSSYPLTIRNAQPNDIYQIKNYQKTVRRLFIDWKMPAFLRKRWPVIVDKNNKVIYVPRYQKYFIPDIDCNFYVKF